MTEAADPVICTTNPGVSRVGVVDVGSNSVRMVVFDGAARSPAYFYNEKIMCGLGTGLQDTGHLHPQGRVRAMQALTRFQGLAKAMGITLSSVATAAVREATDGPAFCDEVAAQTGLRLNVIDGPEEARLSAQGVLLGWPGAQGMICDIGGSSMELAELRDGAVGRCVTSALGPLKLGGIKGGKKGLRKHIRDQIGALRDTMGPQPGRLFLVGGSWRAIARLDMHRRGYPLAVLHEYRMSTKAVQATARWLRDQDLETLRQACGISSNRMSLVPLAIEVLSRLVLTFRPRDIAVSSYGIREGLLYEHMSEDLRARDPLIEACRYHEGKDARLPGFGDRLFDFLRPLFPTAKPERLRLIRAACLLHDVSWRAHPDYRAEVCFDNATRANLGGLRHAERVYLALALMYRYRSRKPGEQFDALFDLLDEADAEQAEALGRAMRLGAMLWPAPGQDLGKLEWRPKRRQLTLRLAPGGMDLFGEVPLNRLNALANCLRAEARVLSD